MSAIARVVDDLIVSVEAPAELPPLANRQVLVVVPTYNEIDNLERVVAGIRELGPHVLIVDDASPDGTGELADSLASTQTGIHVLHRSGKLGLGSAYVAGFLAGLEADYDLFVEMDADGSHLPHHLEAIVEAARSSGGMSIGSRYMPGGGVVGWGLKRWILSRGANVYVRLLLGMPLHDATSGYRCYTRQALERIDLARVFAEGYAFQIEMAYRCFRGKLPVVEVPIRFEDRVLGVSKVSKDEIYRALLAVPRMRLRRYRKPSAVSRITPA